MNKKKHNIVHITIRPKNDLYTEIKYEKLIDWIEGNGSSYCIAEELGNHLHIALKFKKEVRTDVIRKSVMKYMCFDEDTHEKVALKVKFHGDWEYLLGYIHKDGTILEISKDINQEDINKGLDRYKKGDNAVYVQEEKKDNKKIWWKYDEIIFRFARFCIEMKMTEFTEFIWSEFLCRYIDNILPSTHARIRKEPLAEYVRDYIRNQKRVKSGVDGVDITKRMSTNLETTNDTTYMDNMFDDLT